MLRRSVSRGNQSWIPKGKAGARRLEALVELLKYAYHHSVGMVMFENLLTIKRRKFNEHET